MKLYIWNSAGAQNLLPLPLPLHQSLYLSLYLFKHPQTECLQVLALGLHLCIIAVWPW